MQIKFNLFPKDCEYIKSKKRWLTVSGWDLQKEHVSSVTNTIFYYIHTEIYTLKSRRVNFRSQTNVNESNIAYRFSHMWEKRCIQSGAAYHVFSRVSRTATFHSRVVGAVLFCFVSFLLLFKAKVASMKQKGGGKEFELRSQTLTKQPWTHISQLYFISFGFYLSSFAFYEAACFQWLLFDHICLNKACHNIRRVFNLSMYITNIIPHGKCLLRCLHTQSFVSEISLVRFAHLFDFWHTTPRV